MNQPVTTDDSPELDLEKIERRKRHRNQIDNLRKHYENEITVLRIGWFYR